jgi:DNA-binding CsgD family transcriptional regulator
MSVNRALALLAMGEGQFELGARQLERNRPLQAAAGIVAPSAVRWEGEYVLCLVGSGLRGRAQDAVERLAERAERTSSRWGRSVALRGRALLEVSQAEPCAREAISLQADLPFEQAHSRLVLGDILRRGGRVREARVELRHATEQFAACSAWPWMARAESGIRATGIRRASSDSANSRLTEQELRVALVVADGATNRQAAASLFVSEKTVEYHLGKIFRKMGLTNRTQLAGRMLRQVPA